MIVQDIIDKIRLHVGDKRETRFDNATISTTLEESLQRVSEATNASIVKSLILDIIANKTVYTLPADIIKTLRFEQLTPRETNLANMKTDALPVLTERDLANRNFPQVSDLAIEAEYGFRRDTSKSTVVAILKHGPESIEVYPRLTEPTITITQEDLDFWTANGDIDVSTLTVGDHTFVPIRVYYSAYFPQDLTTLNEVITLDEPLARMLVFASAETLLSYDTNSRSQSQVASLHAKYIAELDFYKSRVSESYHDNTKQRHIIKRRGVDFSDNRHQLDDFGTILPIQ